MDAKPKYTEAGFDIEEDFVETLQDIDIRTGIKIAKYIQENEYKVTPNLLVSTVMEGMVISDDNEPITFAVEIIKDHSSNPILSDLKFIDMDEYLDLLNLKLNERRKSNSNKKHS
jgi:hypothetical protein